MTQINVIKHNQKGGSGLYATMVISPESTQVTEKAPVVEKDVHFGLFVLGTEKHDSRRIDNQLRGRSGRQGDPGVSQFYVALDDEIMRKMGGDTIKSIAKRLLPAEELSKLELTQSQFTKSITRAQTQMEGHNFSIRKHLFEYDNVVNKQRMKIYSVRDAVLHRDSAKKDDILHEIAEYIHEVVEQMTKQRMQSEQGEDAFFETVLSVFGSDIKPKLDGKGSIETMKEPQIVSLISTILVEEWDTKTHIIVDTERLIQIVRSLYLESIDKYWIEHIDTMQNLREKVGLYGYAQQDPLVMYKQEAFTLYSQLWLSIKMEFLSLLFKVDFTQFHGMSGAINFDVVDTNEEDFEDSLTGDMSQIQNSKLQIQNDTGVEVIDLAKSARMGVQTDGKKVGPNEPCPCGSGKKYKKCHGA